MSEQTTTVLMQKDGKCTIPANVRKALEMHGEKRYVEITVSVDE